VCGRSPGPRCLVRLGYAVRVPAAPGTRTVMPVVEHRSARCHLEHGHTGSHVATIPGDRDRPRRRVAFTVGR
jgi:hypothetical protein